jgi:NAD(P)-dependent dehydrogenase (short-subunit alcohol dehydrogenase family)
VIVGKLEGKVAVITGGSIHRHGTGRRQAVRRGRSSGLHPGPAAGSIDDAVKLIGRNVTAVQGEAAELDDLDRLYDTVKREKGSIDVLWASAGMGEPAVLGEITEEQFHRAFWLNERGTLFTVQKALPLINDNGSIFMTGPTPHSAPSPAGASTREQSRPAGLGPRPAQRTARPQDPGQRPDPRPGRHRQTGRTVRRGHQSRIRVPDPRGKMGRPEEIATVALFLASDDSSYVNGLELVTDGGTTAI